VTVTVIVIVIVSVTVRYGGDTCVGVTVTMAASVSVTVVYGGVHVCWRVGCMHGTACRWSLTKSVATLSPKCSGLP